ncbi:hypothetical protein [uncultured Draconibacterium sp.]|uniref:hypothetical protein n=1 Tax=uncultured Draconibacterium sp. TaxID=1573823 RepID=UPI0032179194
MKKIVFLILALVGLLFANYTSNAQKVLSEQETQWVLEAQGELEQALSDPEMDETERLRLIERSAKTLKEYGQPWAYPEGDIPLQELMENNFEQCKDNIKEWSDYNLKMQHQTLEQKIKIINQLQVEVGERQLQILIPGGNAAVSLSMEFVNTFFDVNIVDGFTNGKIGNAKDLKNRFIELAKQKKLGYQIDQMIKDDKTSLIELDKDRKIIRIKENKWESIYRNATSSTFTREGYEGAVLNSPYAAQTSTQQKGVIHTNILVGTWRFGFEQTGYFYWTFKNNGSWTFEDKMNGDQKPLNGKYSVFGSTLKLTGPNSECGDVEATFPFVIEDGELRFLNIQDPCMSRRFTLNHVWKQ